MGDTLRGLKPSEKIDDFLVKFEKLSLGRSAIYTKGALVKFAQVLSEGSQQAAIDQALRELLDQITYSLSQYATMEPDSASSADQFIESATSLVAWLADLYGNFGFAPEFWKHLQDYSENSSNIADYKEFLTHLYQTTLANPQSSQSIGTGQVWPSTRPIKGYSDEITGTHQLVVKTPPPPRKTEMGVGNLSPAEPVEELVIPKAPAAESLAGLSSLFETTRQPPQSGEIIEEENTVVSAVPAALAAQTATARPSIPEVRLSPSPDTPEVPLSPRPAEQPEKQSAPQPLPDEEPEEEKTNPLIDLPALSRTNRAIDWQRFQAAAKLPTEKPAEQPVGKPTTTFASNSASVKNSASGIMSAPIVNNPAPAAPTSSIEISQSPQLSPQEEAKKAPFTREGNAALGLPVLTPENPAALSTPRAGSPSPAMNTTGYNAGQTVYRGDALIAAGPAKLPPAPSVNTEVAGRRVDDPEATKVTRLPPTEPSPKAVKSNTRTSLIVALGLLATGAIGIEALMIYKHSRPVSNQDPAPSASASGSAKLSETPQPPKKSVEQPTPQYESGVYKVDTNHPKFKKYLDDIRPATGLIALIRDFAGQTSIQYEQNPAKVAELQKDGKVVFNGTENELDMRIAIAEKMIENAQAQKIENGYVRNFFQNQKKGIANFKRTKTWTALDRGYGVDKFFESIQVPKKYITPPNIIGYAPDIDPIQNPDLKRVAVDAPNFYRIFLQVGKEMQEERDPTKVVQHRDFGDIKTAACDRIDKKGKTLKTSDERSGIAFMHKAWCSPTANPYNDLNKSLMQVVEIAEQPAKSIPNPTNGKAPNANQQQHGSIVPNNIIFNRVNLNDTPSAPNQNIPGQNGPKNSAQPSENPTNVKPRPKFGMFTPTTLENKYVAVEDAPTPVETEQFVYFSRTRNRIKSWFGFGKTAELKTAQVKTTIAPIAQTPAKVALAKPIIKTASAKPAIKTASVEPLYTKKDLPMNSWKQTLKNFFWG